MLVGAVDQEWKQRQYAAKAWVLYANISNSTRQMRRQMVTFAEFGWLSAEADDIDNRNR
jgi:hypothetical protein